MCRGAQAHASAHAERAQYLRADAERAEVHRAVAGGLASLG
jgi:hypothetical protein